ncbi:S-formylglutathione hydrolase FrmB [Halopolyspora algeriensis]|uniref:S-formylglutathione hydrolase FrmB n=1 Tax=Halopolyspora algeriensis TaxID=1500506 RepID=A0A368VXX5_9ACTN|nr:alpha/beta hydrolase-fold protein [Halopolyspora algeriensis]RCW45087.1 S-formylglutathione hydrolase FrmB [Halopolyspora algeriensis]TQM53190.1 S-formylglutathione hydrolase FrmB [Halopolyspora algeriensis]
MEHDGHSRTSTVTRRTALAGGVAAMLGIGAYRWNRSEEQSPAAPQPTTPEITSPAPTAPEVPPTVTIERVYSQARRREVELVTVEPEDAGRSGLPTCLMLHGRWAGAREAIGGLPEWLSPAVAAGTVPAFTFVAVDGGEHSYWHEHPDDDPMGMLLHELPHWLAERGMGGLDGLPFAAAGLSMGGFGTLLYARRRHEHGIPLRVAAVVSPALMTTWEEARERDAFADEAEWAALDPIRHTDLLGGTPLGVWSGTEDSFIEGTRRFIRRADPELVSLTPGEHNHDYFGPATLQAVEFIGTRRPDTLPETVPVGTAFPTEIPARSGQVQYSRSHQPEPVG